MKYWRLVIFGPLTLVCVTALSAGAQSFSDNFNRTDGTVGNGWSTWGNGADISGEQLETFGEGDVAGGVARSFPVTFPVSFSFDFRTDAPADGGWQIGFNSPAAEQPAAVAELTLQMFRGNTGLGYAYQTSGGAVEQYVPLEAGQEDYQTAALSHISGTIKADLSGSVTIQYPDGTQVSLPIPPPVGALTTAPGSTLVLGNENATLGPHYFDNFTISEIQTPLYNVCPLYDASKAVKSGATIPIKLELCDASGNDQSPANVILTATGIVQVSTAVSSEVQDAGNANPDDNFRYDSSLGSLGGYIFNLKTTGLPTGTYNLNFSVTGDPSSYATMFQVK